MDSVLHHMWYLTEDTVIFGLFDTDLSDQQRQEIAQALVQITYPRAPLQLGKPVMQSNLLIGVANPCLASFMVRTSWKLWELLGIDREWLQLPVDQWEGRDSYMIAKDYVTGLTVVNDGAERCIKSISDYATATQDSVYREDILVIGNSHREVFQDLRKAALAELDAN